MTLISSPCTLRCRLDGDTCVECLRTKDQIKNWRTMEEDQRIRIMHSLLKSRCPQCGVNNNCAIEKGKSINTCWCYTLPILDVEKREDVCLCRGCLTK